MIRNRNARALKRQAAKQSPRIMREDGIVMYAPAESHVIRTPAGRGPLPKRAGWRHMQAMKANT